MRATIRMIAERAGVSTGTVDRVLHGRPYVKAEVRERVLQVMESLDYHPNRAASALATSGTLRRLAVVQPDWEGYVGESMAAGRQRFLAERQDYNVAVEVYSYPQDDGEGCLQALRRAVEECQGAAVCAVDTPKVRSALEDLAARNMPAVTFNSDLPQAKRLCFVGENAHHAGRVAGEIAAKLLLPGERVLLIYGNPAYAGHKGRADGFLERLLERGFCREDCQVSVTHNRYDETFQAVAGALASAAPPRCIYMANRSVTACVDALAQAGVRRRVRVLAHDISPEVRRFLEEGTVDFAIGQDLGYQSYQALTALFSAVAEGRAPEREYFYSLSPILNSETA